ASYALCALVTLALAPRCAHFTRDSARCFTCCLAATPPSCAALRARPSCVALRRPYVPLSPRRAWRCFPSRPRRRCLHLTPYSAFTSPLAAPSPHAQCALVRCAVDTVPSPRAGQCYCWHLLHIYPPVT
ncbi:hypothetical protein B0H19DRAFT_1366573, partial [Mycena capillaripes]